MLLKENLNKLHFNLSNRFDVTINEKSDQSIGQYLELLVTEGNKELKVVITKRELENNTFNWSYLSNPLDENSTIVERKSSVNGFFNDVVDIFEKNRFDSDYLEKIKK